MPSKTSPRSPSEPPSLRRTSPPRPRRSPALSRASASMPKTSCSMLRRSRTLRPKPTSKRTCKPPTPPQPLSQRKKDANHGQENRAVFDHRVPAVRPLSHSARGAKALLRRAQHERKPDLSERARVARDHGAADRDRWRGRGHGLPPEHRSEEARRLRGQKYFIRGGP